MSADLVIGGTLVLVGLPVLVVGALLALWHDGANAARYTRTARQMRREARAATDAMLAREDARGSVHDRFRLDAADGVTRPATWSPDPADPWRHDPDRTTRRGAY